MRLFDPNLKGNIPRYILQCIGVTLLVYCILLVVDSTLDRTIISSLGATTFIIFTMPHKNVAKARYVLGGYTIGMVVGTINWLILTYTDLLSLNLACALAIGFSILLMTFTNTEHPPAAAFAYGLVVEGFQIETLLIIYSVTITFTFIRIILKRWLIDLI